MQADDARDNPWKRTRGLRRVLRAASCSLQGLAAAFRHESAFRQEVLLALVLIPLALLGERPTLHRVAMIASVVLVLIVELLNSAVEAVVDRVSTEANPLSKRAKDYGSAAVFLALALVAVTYAALW